jgi:hypothetical protein
MTVRGAPRICVMVVVPTFSVRRKSDKPVVAAILASVEIAISVHMRQRIDSPGNVPAIDRPEDDPVHQKAKAKLYGS